MWPGGAAIGLLVIGFVLALLAMLTNVAIMYVGAQEAARAAAESDGNVHPAVAESRAKKKE